MDPFVLYTFLHDYHSGQGSRGYRILSRFHARGNVRVTSACMAECRETELYAYLVDRYGESV